MADSIHMLLANFRNDLLTSLAKLEFQIRDVNTMYDLPPLVPISVPVSSDGSSDGSSGGSSGGSSNVTETVKKHTEDIAFLTSNLKTMYRILEGLQEEKEQKSNFLEIQPVENTKNVLISTPALQAAVSRANDMGALDLDSDGDDEHEDVIMNGVESDVEYSQVKESDQVKDQDDVENGEDQDDVENGEDQEDVEDGEDQEDVEDVEDQEDVENAEEEEEEENAIEVEEFTYKGTVYHRDEDGNVYLDGDEIGQWNGKKILFHKS